jgi:hypothetical protein
VTNGQLDWMEEAARRKNEPLDPELVPYLYDSEFLGLTLKHPLVFDVPFHKEWAYRDNDQLKQKHEELAIARAERNWSLVIWLHERPFRLEAFEELAPELTDSEYWKLLGEVHVDTENFWQNDKQWARVLRSGRSHREEFMTGEEREAFAGLPDTFPVYRGVNGKGKKLSWAWTLDRGIAKWFARRLDRPGKGKPPTVVRGTVRKEHVIGYLTRRGEEEILVAPKYVADYDYETLEKE